MHSGLLAARLALARRPGRPDPGPGQSGHRHPLGLLRRERRRGRQRRGRPGRPPGRRRCGSPAPTPRERHRGVSHHSLTAYGRVALLRGRHRGARLRCRRSADCRGPGRRRCRRAARSEPAPAGPRRPRPVCATLLADSPVRLSSMGRGLEADPGYFLAAAAAGRHAAALLDSADASWLTGWRRRAGRRPSPVVSFGPIDGRRVAVGVAVGRRDHQQHPAAHGLAGQPLDHAGQQPGQGARWPGSAL